MTQEKTATELAEVALELATQSIVLLTRIADELYVLPQLGRRAARDEASCTVMGRMGVFSPEADKSAQTGHTDSGLRVKCEEGEERQTEDDENARRERDCAKRPETRPEVRQGSGRGEGIL